uniref:Uncharacterized protein n=1 Tax=uncultured marine thaumarchaeote AD1000_01_F04 TaxID=1455879 RepID=A0A075FGQ7_9ARCH|nr:hypothetical protein [uncultured marine thaumarchaeote AD1000_01_F04]
MIEYERLRRALVRRGRRWSEYFWKRPQSLHAYLDWVLHWRAQANPPKLTETSSILPGDYDESKDIQRNQILGCYYEVTGDGNSAVICPKGNCEAWLLEVRSQAIKIKRPQPITGQRPPVEHQDKLGRVG